MSTKISKRDIAVAKGYLFSKHPNTTVSLIVKESSTEAKLDSRLL
jgi:hypothetical protein